jgi:8-oxo-dGTP pyrophosphatase MutT (NUDIX family)
VTDPGDEQVEVVDHLGNVAEITTRRRMRSEVLRHRCTYVAVVVGPVDSIAVGADAAPLDPDSELLVHQRADWKDTYPSYWDVAFGGVCDVGEGWDDAARRELSEEAGIVAAPLVDLGPCRYEDATNRVVGRVYVTAWPDEPRCVDGEVVALDRVRLSELSRWITTRSVCPDSAQVVVPRLLTLLPRPD